MNNVLLVDEATAEKAVAELSREIANAIEESIQLADQGRVGEAQAAINKLCQEVRYKPMVGVIPNGNVKLTEHPVIQHYAQELVANSNPQGHNQWTIGTIFRDEVRSVHVPDPKSADDDEMQHNYHGMSAGNRWRFSHNQKKVFWAVDPLPEEKHAVENHLARKGHSVGKHGSFWEYANKGIANASRFGEANFSIPLNGRGPWTPALKGKLDINDMIREVHGLRIIIENAKGSLRCGYNKNGQRWEVRMPADYGYVTAVDVAANSGTSESVRRSWIKRHQRIVERLPLHKIEVDERVVFRGGGIEGVSLPWFTEDPKEASRYGRVSAYAIRIKNPYAAEGGFLPSKIKEAGHDGAVFKNPMSYSGEYDGQKPQWVPLEKNQVRKLFEEDEEFVNSFVQTQAGADGDGVDCWLGEVPSEQVHIIDQRDLDTKKFDEHKCFVDFASRQAAIDTYIKAYHDGRGQERIMGVRTLSIPQFKAWLQTAKTKKRASRKNFVNATMGGSEDQSWQKDHHDAVRNEIEAVYREALDDALTEGGEELVAAQKDGHGEAALAALLLLIGMRLKAAAQRSYRGSLMGLGSVLKGPTAARAASGYSVLRAAKLKNAVTKLGSTISASVQRGVAGGESPQAILRRLKEAVQPEVDLIAETETQVTYGTVQNLALALSGFTKKIWVTMADERVRHSHALCEAQGAIPLDHKFTNGLRFPGDPEGPASEVINCRCYLLGVK